MVQAPRNANGILYNKAFKNETIMACIEVERKKAFVVFASTYEAAVSHLTLEQMGELFLKMGRYSLEGEDVHSENPMVDIILKMTIPNMEAAEKRHQAAIENGKKGKDGGGGIGAPRKGETKEEYQARLLEWKRSRELSNNPQEPLNNNTDKDIKKHNDVKTNKDIENKIDINNNIEVVSNSISTNQVLSSNQDYVPDNTKTGSEPRQDKTSYQDSFSDSKIEKDYSKNRERPRQEEKPRQGNNNDFNGTSDFIRNITLDDSNLEDDVPPCPPDPRYMNYAGSIQDFIRYDAEPDYEEMTDAEMMDAAKDSIDEAVETETKQGKTQRFWDLMLRAKRIYMHLNGCSEESAKEFISRLYKKKKRKLDIVD